MSENRSLEELEQIENQKYAEFQAVQNEHSALQTQLTAVWQSKDAKTINELINQINEVRKREHEAYIAWADIRDNLVNKYLDNSDLEQDELYNIFNNN
jgi:hypothetical protein